MSVLYYKTEKTSQTGLKFQHLIYKSQDAKKEIDAFVEKIGATPIYLTSDRYCLGTGLVAVQFDEVPDFKQWKEFKCNVFGEFYSPRSNTKKGRDLNIEMMGLPTINRDEISAIIGIEDIFKRCGFNFGKTDFYGFSIDSQWNHNMPQDCIEITGTQYENL